MTPRKKTKAAQKIERFKERTLIWRSSPKATPNPNIALATRQFNID